MMRAASLEQPDLVCERKKNCPYYHAPAVLPPKLSPFETIPKKIDPSYMVSKMISIALLEHYYPCPGRFLDEISRKDRVFSFFIVVFIGKPRTPLSQSTAGTG